MPKRRRTGEPAAHARPRVEPLEDRLALSWAATPPASIRPPVSPVVVGLNRLGDAAGTGWINGEVDYYRFAAGAAGTYRVSAATPGSPLDTVLAAFDAAGR